MNRKLLVLAAILLISSLTGHAYAQGASKKSDAGTFTFVGHTGAPGVNGGAGYTGLTDECRSAFGDTARPCTTKEFILSAEIVPAGGSWINAEIVGNDGATLVDYSGIARTHDGLSCSSWTSSTAAAALAVIISGGISTRSCNIA